MNPVAILGDALMITGFVFVMMLIVEVVNVASAGAFQRVMRRGGPVTYVGSGLLGSAPGCLGSFAAVAMYVHGALPFGALVSNMIATSGDEAFVMLALFPGKAVFLFAILLVYGVVVGVLTDRVMGGRSYAGACCPSGLAVHETEQVRLFSRPAALEGCSFPRATLCLFLALFILAVATGTLGPIESGWIRFTLITLAAIAFWISFWVPEHFLEEHLWRHVAREHLPRIFLWVLGVLVLLKLAEAGHFPVVSLVRDHPWAALLAAGLIGIVPESGPHLVFVTLFAQGGVPFSVLLVSSVVQDGHGALPLLAESRREFVKVKAISLVAGLALGSLLLAVGL
jgi:Putative, 10TM heavy-metal exporter